MLRIPHCLDSRLTVNCEIMEMRNKEATQILVTFNGVYKFGVVITVLNKLQFYIIHNFAGGRIATRCPMNSILCFPLHGNTLLTYTKFGNGPM
jgi:hypothetical protein